MAALVTAIHAVPQRTRAEPRAQRRRMDGWNKSGQHVLRRLQPIPPR